MNLPQIKQYEFDRFLGEGACGYVYACRSGEDQVALKLFKGLAIDRGFLEGSLERIREAGDHPHLATVLDCDLQAKPAYVATGLWVRETGAGWEGAAAERVMAGWDAERVWPLLGQMAEGLGWLHRSGVPHCGFGPGNVLVDEQKGHAWITDYAQGWIKGIYHMETASHWRFSAPEQLRDPAVSEWGRGFRWDVYAFGATAVYLLTGRHLRAHDFLEELVRSGERDLAPAALAERITAAPLEWPLGADEDPRWAVLRRCVCEDPAERYADMREVALEWERIERGGSLDPRQTAGSIQVRAGKKLGNRMGRRVWKVAGLTAAAGAMGFCGTGWWRSEQENLQYRQTMAEQVRQAGETQRNAAVEAEAAVIAWGEAERRVELLGDNLEEVLKSSETLLEALLQSDPESPGRRPYQETLASVEVAFRTMMDQTAGRPDLIWARVRAAAGLASILEHTGREDQAVQLYDEARRILETLPEGSATRGSQRILEVEVFSELAGLFGSCGHPEEGLSAARQAVKLAVELGRGEGVSPGLQRVTALAKHRLAVLEAELGRTALAIEEGQMAIQLLETILEGEPGTAGDRQLLAQCQSNVARWLDWRGEFGQALEGFREAAGHFEILAIAAPSNRDYRFQLARCRLDLGKVIVWRLGQREEAVRELEAAAELLRSLVNGEPGSQPYRLGLGQALAQLAQTERDYGSHERAAAYAGEARTLLDGLDPDASKPEVCAEVILVHTLLGLLLLDAGDPAGAMEEAEAAWRSLDGLEEQGFLAQADGATRARLADSCGDLSQMFLAMDRASEARAVLGEAVSAWRELAERFTDDERIHAGLEWSEGMLSRLP